MTIWIVEKRHADGTLDLSEPQPEKYFGNGAITGIKDHVMAQVVWRFVPTAVLNGGAIAVWPTFLNPQFIARRKTW